MNEGYVPVAEICGCIATANGIMIEYVIRSMRILNDSEKHQRKIPI